MLSSSPLLSEASSATQETSRVFALVIGACIALFFLRFWSAKENRKNNYSPPSPPAGSKFVTVPNNSNDNDSAGIKIRYEEHTSSSKNEDEEVERVTIVLIHGHMGCLETFNLLLPHLLLTHKEKIKKIITVDQVGYGYSDKPTRFTYSHDQQGDVLYQVLEKLNVTNAILVGHSSGCIIASRVASIDSSSRNNEDNSENNRSTKKRRRVTFSNYPRVKGIILTAPGGLFSDKPSFLSWTIMYPLCYFIAKTILSKRRASLLKYHVNTDCLTKNEEELMNYFLRPTQLCKTNVGNDNNEKDMIDKEAIRVVADTFAVKEEPYLQSLYDIHSNVFIHFIFAAQDSIYDLNDEGKKQKVDGVVSQLKKKHGACSKIIVENTNHYIHHEQPEELAKIILGVVDSVCT